MKYENKPQRPSFENFKSTICHRVKEMGDNAFLIDALESDEILTLYDWEWYPECLYLLAMVDYISRMNEVPLCKEYDWLRRGKLDEVVFPADIMIIDAIDKDAHVKDKAWEDAIPEFKRFNIVENEVRSVI